MRVVGAGWVALSFVLVGLCVYLARVFTTMDCTQCGGSTFFLMLAAGFGAFLAMAMAEQAVDKGEQRRMVYRNLERDAQDRERERHADRSEQG